MKSGSRHVTPSGRSGSTDCGTSRSRPRASRRPAPSGRHGRQRLRLGQAAEHAVERSRRRVGTDGADHATLTRPRATTRAMQRTRSSRVIAATLSAVPLSAAHRGDPGTPRRRSARRPHVRDRSLVAQARDGLRAHALDRIRVEARLGEREAQQLEGLVGMLDERFERAADGVRPAWKLSSMARAASRSWKASSRRGRRPRRGAGRATGRRPAFRPGPAPRRPRRRRPARPTARAATRRARPRRRRAKRPCRTGAGDERVSMEAVVIGVPGERKCSDARARFAEDSPSPSGGRSR